MGGELVLFTMKSCPYCTMMKDMLTENNISFHDRDIDLYPDEFELFVEAVGGNEYVPSFMIIKTDEDGNLDSELYAPDQHYHGIDEGIEIIKKKLILD